MKALDKLYNGIKKIIKRPKQRSVYAVTAGSYMGEFFVCIEKVNDKYYFLSLPDLIIRSVDDKDFEYAIENKVLDFIEMIPRDIFKVCEKQYRENKTIK